MGNKRRRQPGGRGAGAGAGTDEGAAGFGVPPPIHPLPPVVAVGAAADAIQTGAATTVALGGGEAGAAIKRETTSVGYATTAPTPGHYNPLPPHHHHPHAAIHPRAAFGAGPEGGPVAQSAPPPHPPPGGDGKGSGLPTGLFEGLGVSGGAGGGKVGETGGQHPPHHHAHHHHQHHPHHLAAHPHHLLGALQLGGPQPQALPAHLMAGGQDASASAALSGGGGKGGAGGAADGGAGAAAAAAAHHGFHGLGTSAAFAAAGMPHVPPALQLQLDPQIKAALAQGQPVHHLKVLIEEHLKMEERKHRKRAANRRSASSSRARKKKYIERLTNENRRLQRISRILGA